MGKLKVVHVRVSGRVQGVGFRYFTREVAVDLGLEGYVQNLPDGIVEAVVSGKDHLPEAFLGQLRRGPGGSRVERVVIEEVKTPLNKGFLIKR